MGMSGQACKKRGHMFAAATFLTVCSYHYLFRLLYALRGGTGVCIMVWAGPGSWFGKKDWLGGGGV